MHGTAKGFDNVGINIGKVTLSIYSCCIKDKNKKSYLVVPCIILKYSIKNCYKLHSSWLSPDPGLPNMFYSYLKTIQISSE